MLKKNKDFIEDKVSAVIEILEKFASSDPTYKPLKKDEIEGLIPKMVISSLKTYSKYKKEIRDKDFNNFVKELTENSGKGGNKQVARGGS